MSRRGQKPLHQPKAFVSFGDVSGFQSVNTYDKKTAPSSSVPLYTGDDNDLASVSKKVMKKDPTTKVKAIHELGEILLSKPEYSIAEFLPFFVYCYSKLCLEDSRTVREKLNASIDAITSVEKRLLAHHMKNLIGPWWMLTGDPAPEVAERAYGSFCNAIPPKKRQQVLVHLSSAILSEAVRNLRQRPETLSDMSVATLQEAEERLERVLVSTLASVGKFVSLLSSEQNLSLTPIGGEDSEDAGNARYRDFFNDGMWAKCLSNTYPSVRKAAYQLLDTVLVHIPIVLRVSDEESSAVSSVFCAQFVRCLLEESHFPNMAHLVNSFVLVVKHLKAFVQQVSVHDGIVPAMHRLMQSHPQLTLEYLLPIAGSLPAESVALLEVELEGLQGGPAPGSGDSSRDKGLDALCDFLRSLSEYAELQSTEGLQQDSAERSAVPSGPRKRLANHKHALLRGRKVVCAVNSMRADVCVVELSTLLLLRRTQTNAASAGTLLDAVAPVSAPAPAPAPVTPRLQDVLAQLVQSIVLTIQSAAVSIRSELSMAGAAAASSKPSGHLRRALLAQARYDQHADSTDATVICEATNRSLQAVAKSLVQLQRATLLGIHLPSSAWTELFWLPLGESVLDLLVGTTGLGAAGSESSTEVDVVQGGGADDGSGKVVESALSTIAVVDAIVKAFAQTWSEKVDSGPISAPQEDMAGIGAHFIASSLVGHVRAALSMDGSKAFPLFSNLMHAVMQSQLLLSLCDRSCGLLGRTVPLSSATELLAAGWWKPMLPQLQLSSGTREKNIPVISSFFACGLADVASFLSLAGPRAEVLRACHRLATYCAEAASIEGACVICRQLNKSDELSRAAWTADSIEWVRSAGAEYLAGRSGGMLVSNSLKLQFLLLFSSNSAMGDVPAAWLEQARSSWNCSRVTIAELFLLTLLASALDAHSGGGAPLLPTVKSTTLAWAQDCNKQLHDCLTKLFFARIRTRDYKSQTPSRARAGADPLKDVVFVTSWAEVQNFLLPVLPQDEKLALHNSIATVLDASLERDADGGRDVLADDDVDGEGEGPVSPAKVCEGQRYGLAPRKWVRHFRGLIAVSAAATSPAQNTPAEHTQGQLGASSSPWKLLRADYWVGRLALLLEETPMDFSGELPTTLFALECIDLLLSDDAMMDPVAIESLRRQPVVLLWTLLVTERVRRSPTQSVSCAFVEQHVLAFIRDLPSASKLSLFSALLSRAFVPDHLSSLLPRVQELRLAVLRRLLADELPSATSKQESIMLVYLSV